MFQYVPFLNILSASIFIIILSLIIGACISLFIRAKRLKEDCINLMFKVQGLREESRLAKIDLSYAVRTANKLIETAHLKQDRLALLALRNDLMVRAAKSRDMHINASTIRTRFKECGLVREGNAYYIEETDGSKWKIKGIRN